MRRVPARAILVLLLFSELALGAVTPEIATELGKAKHVYVASTRKDGSLGAPAEIWFLFHQGAVYVATPPTSWRVKRIQAGRTRAKIWVGSPDGPSFGATGAVVQEPAVHPVLFETFAKKYAESWKGFEDRFRKGLADGSRVLVKYTPD